jgi:hypothetical protein
MQNIRIICHHTVKNGVLCDRNTWLTYEHYTAPKIIIIIFFFSFFTLFFFFSSSSFSSSSYSSFSF